MHCTEQEDRRALVLSVSLVTFVERNWCVKSISMSFCCEVCVRMLKGSKTVTRFLSRPWGGKFQWQGWANGLRSTNLKERRNYPMCLLMPVGSLYLLC